jgi:hypothetical protein
MTTLSIILVVYFGFALSQFLGALFEVIQKYGTKDCVKVSIVVGLLWPVSIGYGIYKIIKGD